MSNRQTEHLLTLALVAHSFGERPSARLGILDSSVAFDLDTAAAHRLTLYEDTRRLRYLYLQARIQAAFVWGAELGGDDLTDALPRASGNSPALERHLNEFFGKP